MIVAQTPSGSNIRSSNPTFRGTNASEKKEDADSFAVTLGLARQRSLIPSLKDYTADLQAKAGFSPPL